MCLCVSLSVSGLTLKTMNIDMFQKNVKKNAMYVYRHVCRHVHVGICSCVRVCVCVRLFSCVPQKGYRHFNRSLYAPL